MDKFNVSILAMIPSRSHLGVAIYRRGGLAFYTSKSLRQHRSMSEVRATMRKTISEYERRFGIDLVVVPELNKQQRRSAAVVAIAAYLKTICRSQHLTSKVIDLVAVRAGICGDARPTKENTASELSRLYPELRRHLISNRPWERRYYGTLFDAIALGESCLVGLNSPSDGPKASEGGG
jgi:hypothetical protein